MEDGKKRTAELVDKLIASNNVVIFSTSTCKYCTKVKELLTKNKIEHLSFNMDTHQDFSLLANELYKRTRMKTVPNVFVRGHHIGGYDDVIKLIDNGIFYSYLDNTYPVPLNYDLIIVGGGSGGVSAAKEAARHKKRVAVFDFVKPTIHGTVWGVGGTCVNVGCIPKKLMHEAAIVGEVIEDNEVFGWKVNKINKSDHAWSVLVNNVQKYIKKMNFDYLKYFKLNKIDYFNEKVIYFKNIHTIETTDKNEKVRTYSAHAFILSVGGRPSVPDFPGNDLVITSDDLFSLKTKPGKTLIVGSSYVGLECAGFLHYLGISVTIAVRSTFLRGFDQQIAEMIAAHFESIGIVLVKNCVTSKVEKGKWPGVDPSQMYKVTLANVNDKSETVLYFNLVIMAVGRNPETKGLGLENVGVMLNEKNGKVIVDSNDKTACHTMYAIGDVRDGGVELTPVAVKSGALLVRRLYSSGGRMDYEFIPTTIFTPIEYGLCGYSEEKANEIYGPTDVECFHSSFQPYNWLMQNRNRARCYAKLVCIKSSNLKVVGIHILSPNAGEIVQGFALAIKMNATKYDFDKLVGIHPTSAEVFTGLKITRSEQPTAPEKDC